MESNRVSFLLLHGLLFCARQLPLSPVEVLRCSELYVASLTLDKGNLCSHCLYYRGVVCECWVERLFVGLHNQRASKALWGLHYAEVFAWHNHRALVLYTAVGVHDIDYGDYCILALCGKHSAYYKLLCYKCSYAIVYSYKFHLG